MKEIINWTFGAFFRTLGRLLVYLLLFTLLGLVFSKSSPKIPFNRLFSFMEVKATTTTGWANNFTLGESNFWFDCTGANTCTTSKTLHEIKPSNSNRVYMVGDGSVTIASNGTAMAFRYYMAKDYLYSVQIGICSNKSLSSIFNSGTYDIYPGVGGNGGSNLTKYSYAKNWGTASTNPWTYDVDVGTNCYVVNKFIVPSDDLYTIYLRLKSNTSITGFTPAIIGYNIEPIGIYNKSLESAIQSAIDSSGFATADSVEEVNNSVNEVKEQVNNIDNTITDETSPDISVLGDSAGWLPPGPLDSIINLPLTMLTSLSNGLGSTCSTLNISLPFVDKTLPIPCLKSIYNDISPGLLTFINSIFTIIAGIILYNYLLYLYNWVDDVTSLKHGKSRFFGAKSDVDNWGGVE